VRSSSLTNQRRQNTRPATSSTAEKPTVRNHHEQSALRSPGAHGRATARQCRAAGTTALDGQARKNRMRS
jgi:hypothetical protein